MFIILNEKLTTQCVPALIYSLARAPTTHSLIIIIPIYRAPSKVIPVPIILFSRRSNVLPDHMILFHSPPSTPSSFTTYI